MKVVYKNRSIEKLCTDAHAAEKKLGSKMAEKLHQRIDEISAAGTVEIMVQYRIGRCHQLNADRKGQYVVDLLQPYRLIFEKHGDEIQIAKIMEIVDYH